MTEDMKKFLLVFAAMLGGVCMHAHTEPIDTMAVAMPADTIAVAETIDLNPTDLFDQYNLGRDYLEGSDATGLDLAKGLYWIEQSASQGLADAQLLAGICRYSGVGCEADEAEALRWLNLAAAQNQPYSFYLLGSICANHDPADWQSATKWFEKGASLKEPRCQTELAICHINGEGVDLDYSKAAGLLTEAIKADIPDAYFYLGMLYRHGAGVPKDEVKSRLLLEKAAALGNENAQRLLK